MGFNLNPVDGEVNVRDGVRYTWDASKGAWIKGIAVVTDDFDKNLSETDQTLQQALNTIDELVTDVDVAGATVDSTNFDNVIGPANTTVQQAFDALDDHNHDGRYIRPLDPYVAEKRAMAETKIIGPTDGVVTLNLENGNNFHITLQQDVTVAYAGKLALHPSVLPGQGGIIEFTQDGVGGHNVTFGTDILPPKDDAGELIPFTIPTAADAKFLVAYHISNSKEMMITSVQRYA